MAIDIIASVIPNISCRMDKQIRFYVYLTPRISCSGIAPLGDFRHVYNWTDYFGFFLNKVNFTLRDNKGKPIASVVGTPVTNGYRGEVIVTRDWHTVPDKPNVESADQSKWAKTIWRSLVNQSTPVNGWELDKNAYRLLQKLDPGVLNQQMNDTILQYKQQLLTTSLKDLAIPGFYDSQQDEEDQRAALLDILNHLYDLSVDRKLASPYINNPSKAINFPAFLQALHDVLAAFSAQRDQEVSDLSLKLSLQQVEENNNNETNEFHKKMAAFGNFPFLLRQTGWIWEYSVEKTDFSGVIKDNPNFFIQVEFNVPPQTEDDSGPTKCDNCLPLPPLPPGADVRDHPDNLKDFQDNVRFAYPVTALAVRKKPTDAYTIDYGFKPIGKDFPYFRIDDGLIDTIVDPAKAAIIKAEYLEKNQIFDRITQVLQQKYNFSYHTDQAAGSNANQQRLTAIAANQPPQNQQEINTVNQERINAADKDSGTSPTIDYNSVGVSVSVENLKDAVQKAVTNSPGMNFSLSKNLDPKGWQAFEASAIIYGHNLHKGYRVDFFTPGSFTGGRSLTKRRTYYTIDFKKQVFDKDDLNSFYQFPGCIVNDDEGWVVESAQGSNSGSLYVDGELFRFNDWSLCTDRLFQSTDNTGNANEASIAQNSNISLFSIPQQHSLPRLRYGFPYDIVLRFVDICGSGRELILAPLNPTTDGTYPVMYPQPNPASQVTHLPSYPRTQGVSAPLAFLGRSLHRHNNRTDKYRPDAVGEDLVTMVIRSYYDGGAGFYCHQDSIRYIAPPKLEFDIVKKHGVLDALMADVGGINPHSESEKASQKLQSLITYDVAPKRLDKQEDHTEHVIPDGKEIDYLFDPLCNGYSLTVNGIDELPWPLTRAAGDDLVCTDFRKTYLDDVRYNKLVLATDIRTTPYDYDIPGPDPTNALKVVLQQGMEKELNLTPSLYKTLTTPDFKNRPIEDLLYHKQISTSTLKLRLVHAVQRPCMLYVRPNGNNFYAHYNGDLTTYDRPLGETLVNISLSFDYFPCLTADTYILHVGYEETIAYRKKYLPKTKAFPNGEVNKKGYITQHVNKVIKTGIVPDIAGIEQAVVFSELSHTFNDSKYRQVSYQLEAVSRFKKYFADDVKEFSVVGFDPIGSAAINSCNPPPALEVDRIVPLIRWKGDLQSGLERICDTIRIYFTGDWFLTGGGPEDESVAVFFVNMDGVNSQFVPRELENVISQMGLDPATDHSTSAASLPLIDEYFFEPGSGRLAPKISFVEYESGELIRIKNLDFENGGNNAYCDDTVMAAKYKVQFMPSQEGEDQGEYYIDIRITRQEDLKKLYFPFIRFAIARFQENTIDTIDENGDGFDSRFSKVVVTDFVQLLPYRKIARHPNGDLVYSAGAIRATPLNGDGTSPFKLKPNELVLLHDENRVSGVTGLTNVCLTHSENDPIPITMTDTDIQVGNVLENSSWTLEEYECYDSPVSVAKSAAREDFTQRLIFNYFHQP